MDAATQTARTGPSAEMLAARLEKLRAGTDVKLDSLAQSARQSMFDMNQDVSTRPAKTDQRRQAGIDRIHNLDLAGAAAAVDKDQREIVQVIAALAEASGQIDENFKVLGEPNAEDDAYLAQAKQAITDAEDELRRANARWFNFFGWKDAAIAEAQKHIKDAEKGVKLAEVEIMARISERLKNGNFKTLFNHFTLMTQKSIDVMKVKLKATTVEQQATSAAKKKAFTDKTETTELMQDLDTQLEEVKSDLATLQAQLVTLKPNTGEYSDKQDQISEKEAELRQKETDRNSALVKTQELEKFIQGLETHETALSSIAQCLTLSIQTLQTDLPLRIKSYEAALRVQEGQQSLRIAGKITEVGRETDQRLIEESAATGAAAMRESLKIIQQAPQAIRDAAEVRANFIKALVPVMKGMEDEVKKVYDNNGMDPTQSLFYTHLTEAGDGSGEREAA